MDATEMFEGAAFRKSDKSGDTGCVEIATRNHRFGVRDSKRTAGAVLAFDSGEWRTFIGDVKRGEFDLTDLK